MDKDAAPVNPEAAPSTNQPEAPAEPQAPATPTADIPADKIEEFNKFVANNGGYEKAFAKLKNDVTGRNADQPKAPEAPAQPQQPAQAPTEPTQPPKPAEGYLSAQDIAVMQYRNMLAGDYKELGEYITKGEFLDEMTSLGIQTVDAQGNLNNNAIRKFLDIKKQTLPPAAPANVTTNTPTVDYVAVGDKVETYEQALQIMQQSVGLQRQGIAPHPKLEEAKKMVEEHFKAKTEGKR